MEEKKKNAYSKGLAILFILVVLTLGEFFIGAIASSWWAPLLGVAVLKAFLIIRDYMHIGRLFAQDEVSE